MKDLQANREGERKQQMVSHLLQTSFMVQSCDEQAKRCPAGLDADLAEYLVGSAGSLQEDAEVSVDNGSLTQGLESERTSFLEKHAYEQDLNGMEEVPAQRVEKMVVGMWLRGPPSARKTRGRASGCPVRSCLCVGMAHSAHGTAEVAVSSGVAMPRTT